ncbi:15878_t:CDS:1 [Acaulospora morrowiae]|uniref:15878_t:CDS:1 n=1 Tax=Acaulospora morrowiae TaxID=94023 RepID=A0A9N9GR01_9GLOM|nr:15878_t:CDS:1 [Acaulospora morrowiae]
MKVLLLQMLTKANKLLNKKDKINITFLLAFKLKLLSETLPSRQLLHNCYPSIYIDNICLKCLTAVETQSHIFDCYKNIAAYNKIKNKLKASITKLARKNNAKKNPSDIESKI